MLWLLLFHTFVSKMCPKVSGKPKRADKHVMLSMKLDVIKHFGCVQKDIVRPLNLPVFTICTIYTQRES